LLFQSYTGGRSAEFVHSSKGKASEDPLGEADEANEKKRCQEREDVDNDEDSSADDGFEFDDEGVDNKPKPYVAPKCVHSDPG
jgi:hypothetical protein